MKSLIEWHADQEKMDVEEAKQFIQTLMNLIITEPYHEGDCTSQSRPCNMCVLEIILSDYYKYFKKEK